MDNIHSHTQTDKVIIAHRKGQTRTHPYRVTG